MICLHITVHLFFFILFFIYLFVIGCAGSLLLHEEIFSNCSKQGLLIAVAFPVAEQGLYSAQFSVVMAHGLVSCGPPVALSTDLLV